MTLSITGTRQAAKGPSGRFFPLFQAAILLPIPLLSLFLISPTTAEANRPDDFSQDDAVRSVLQKPFLISDLHDLANVEKSMRPLQDRISQHQQQVAAGEMQPGSRPLAASPLLLWNRINRTARRHKATLDYFLGFGY